MPIWGRAGREILYRRGTEIMRVGLTTSTAVQSTAPERLFEELKAHVGPVRSDHLAIRQAIETECPLT